MGKVTGPGATARSTARDVAALAGVSVSAVSRTFTENASVSPTTRAKVEKAASQLSYRPPVIPKIMLTGRSGIVAVIVSEIQNPFVAEALTQFVESFQKAGRETLLVQRHKGESLSGLVKRLDRFYVDAILCAQNVSTDEEAAAIAAYNIPLVSLFPGSTNAWVRSVTSDDSAAGALAAEHLHASGARRLAYIGGGVASTNDLRFNSFQRSSKALGLGKPVSVSTRPTYDGGQDGARKLLLGGRGEKGFDGLFCVNDLSAFGAMDVLRQEFDLCIPQDVRVIGHDAVQMGSWGAYRLTSFQVDMQSYVEAVLTGIENRPGARNTVVLPSLVKRESTIGSAGRCCTDQREACGGLCEDRVR